MRSTASVLSLLGQYKKPHAEVTSSSQDVDYNSANQDEDIENKCIKTTSASSVPVGSEQSSAIR